MRTTDMNRTFRARAVVIVTAVLCVCVATRLNAHDPGLSSLELRVSSDRIVGTLSVAGADARAAAGERARTFAAFTLDSIELALDGVPLSGSVESSWEGDSEVRVVLAFHRTAGSRLTVRSAIPRRLAPGHRQLLIVRESDGRPLLQRILDARQAAVEVGLESIGRRSVLRPLLALCSLFVILAGVYGSALIRESSVRG